MGYGMRPVDCLRFSYDFGCDCNRRFRHDSSGSDRVGNRKLTNCQAALLIIAVQRVAESVDAA